MVLYNISVITPVAVAEKHCTIAAPGVHTIDLSAVTTSPAAWQTVAFAWHSVGHEPLEVKTGALVPPTAMADGALGPRGTAVGA